MNFKIFWLILRSLPLWKLINCFSPTLPATPEEFKNETKFKFLRFEECFSRAPFSWQISWCRGKDHITVEIKFMHSAWVSMVSHVTTIYSQLIFILNDISFLFFQRIKRQKWECFSSIRKKNYLSYLLPRRKRLYSCQDEWDHLDNLRTWTTGWMKRCWRFPSEHLHGLLYSLLTRKLVEIRSK